ncbi:MAG TPA: DUF72 domain-containing protein [candidate division Zixibacteria bacterium]|nr:DUF72 domain-containing protein [candidate division Zixibacteria bacterium]
MSTGKYRIGTSGFSYKDWLGNFYPQFCPQADFLRFYSSRFNAVEIDATFYRIPSAAVVERWCKNTPDDFVFSAKFPKAVTHEGTIEERLVVARRFIEVMKGLGDKQGPLLLQFAAGFGPERFDLLIRLIEALPSGPRYSIELRKQAWLEVPALFDLLREKNIALCLIEHPRMPRMDIATADFHYLRFLGDRSKIREDFSYLRDDRESDLHWWRQTIKKIVRVDQDLFAFFNNHYSGHSPSTAARMMTLLSESD